MRSRNQVIYSFLLIIGVLVLINVLSATFFARIDLTEDSRYTLSKATKKNPERIKTACNCNSLFFKGFAYRAD